MHIIIIIANQTKQQYQLNTITLSPDHSKLFSPYYQYQYTNIIIIIFTKIYVADLF
jgi:hypothetical protein